MLKRSTTIPKTLKEIYVHRYQPYKNIDQYVELKPGKHQVVVDDNKEYVLAYVEEIELEQKVYHVLAPFTAAALDRRVGEERVKLIINGRFAHDSVKIDPTDRLNDIFFHSVEPFVNNIVTVTAVPIPVIE